MKRAELLLLPDDELELAEAITSRFPGVRFVDNRRWERPDAPPAFDSIADCGLDAAIWNPAVAPVLPVSIRENGIIDGPQVGPVVQWLRSRVGDGGVLQPGSWASSNDAESDIEMIGFVNAVWKLMMKQTTNKLRRGGTLDGPVTANVAERQFRVGRRAIEAAKQHRVVLASNRMRLIPE